MIHDFISACVYGLAERLRLGDTERTPRALNFATAFVHSQILKMPRLIRIAFIGVMVSAVIFCWLKFRVRPSRLAPAVRADFLRGLETSKFGPWRDLSRLLVSFTVIGIFSAERER